jgi:sulfide dehydrogenase cytochrome subunit
MFIRTSVFVACALFSGAILAAPVEELVKPCAACHGASGISSAPATPHLGGQIADYLQQEISGIASGERASAVADHVPKTWTQADIAAVAKFYANNKGGRPVQAIDAEKVAQGAKIYNNRCAECHTNKGRGSDKDAPLMAAQNLEYMAEQTKLYLSGKRRFPFMMDDAYRGLKAEELEAVAHFFASQN